MKKIELMSPAGSLANLKAAVAAGADAVYFGLQKFGARASAANFRGDYLAKAMRICQANDERGRNEAEVHGLPESQSPSPIVQYRSTWIL